VQKVGKYSEKTFAFARKIILAQQEFFFAGQVNAA